MKKRNSSKRIPLIWQFLGFLPKTRFFGKKRGGTPKPQVKKVVVTPNSDQVFASAAARRGSGRPRRAAADAKI